MKIFKILSLVTVLFISLFTNYIVAQESHTLKGQILDMNTKNAVENVRISVVAEKAAASYTDAEGRFSVKVLSADKMLVSIISSGYTSIERFLVEGEEEIFYLQKEENYSLDKTFTSTTGKLAMRQMNQAAEVVNTEGLTNASIESVDEFLKKSTALTTSLSGAPGEGAVVNIRGYSTLFSDSRPLWVVDGVMISEFDFEGGALRGYNTNLLLNINPEDVAEIVILKDASATAIYGSRAANGVIVITTTRARSGQTVFNVSGHYGINFEPKEMPVLGGAQYKNFLQSQMFSAGMTGMDVYNNYPYFGDAVSDENPGYYNYNKNTNWQNEVFEAQSKSGAKLDVSGGDEVARYYISGNYTQNSGNLSNSKNSRYGMRINTEVDVTSRLHLYSNMGFSYSNLEQFEQGAHLGTNPMYAAMVKPSFMAPFQYNKEDVKLSVKSDADELGFSNPTALATNGVGSNSSLLFNGNLSFLYDFSERSYLNFVLGLDYGRFRDQVFFPDWGVDYEEDRSAKQFVSEGVSSLRSSHAEITFNLDNKSLLTELFTMKGGVRFNNKSVKQDIGWGKDTGSDQFKTLDKVSAVGRNKSGYNLDYSDIGLFVNGNINYLNRYFVNATVSADMSSTYGADAYSNLLGSPTSVSYALGGAWDMANDFDMDKQAVSLLKLRVSFGKVVNQGIGAYRSKDYYIARQYSTVAGLVKGNLANTSLEGENITKTNIGLDGALFSSRVTFSANYYNDKTSNLLGFVQLSPEYGADEYWKNKGNLSTKGWELSVNTCAIDAGIKWTIGATVGAYKQSLSGLSEDFVLDFGDGEKLFANGKAPGLFYGYKMEGVISTAQEAQDLGLTNINGVDFNAGDVRFANTNSDKVINNDDKQNIGNPTPDIYGSFFSGLKYKNFSLNMDISYSLGNEVYNGTRKMLESMDGYENQSLATSRRWQVDGHVTDMPRAVYGDPTGNSTFSSRWIEDGSYLRLSSLTLAMDVSKYVKVVNKAQVYFTGNNLLTISNYKGFDPEFAGNYGMLYQGVDYGKFPQVSSFVFGIKLGL